MQVRRRIAMAVEAPLHPQRCRAPCHRHLVDAAVTLDAGNAFGDVDAVIEIDEVGQRVNTVPGDRQAALRAAPQGRKDVGLGEELRVARQADGRRRQAGEGARFDRREAVAAIESVVADVVLVTERNRLGHGGVFSCPPGIPARRGVPQPTRRR